MIHSDRNTSWTPSKNFPFKYVVRAGANEIPSVNRPISIHRRKKRNSVRVTARLFLAVRLFPTLKNWFPSRSGSYSSHCRSSTRQHTKATFASGTPRGILRACIQFVFRFLSEIVEACSRLSLNRETSLRHFITDSPDRKNSRFSLSLLVFSYYDGAKRKNDTSGYYHSVFL